MKPATVARAVTIAAGAALVTACSAQPLPLGATEQSRALHGMWVVFFWSGIGVAIVIYGLIAWCVLRYRRRSSDAAFPVQFRRNSRWEIVYTAIPLLMVVGLFLITFAAERHVEAIARQQDVVVDVTGFRWSWKFDYPQLGVSVTGTPHDPPTFELPIDETTRFNVTSVDVDHSFWVPAFLFKRDAIPGLQNVFDWTPNKLGDFRGECGEFCGLDHAAMTFGLRVVSRADFAHWIAAQHRVAIVGRGAAR
jgi:cytochrome c oxidase subunit 2